MNVTTLLGRLTRDPETSYLPSGTAVSKFSLATSERYQDKDGNKQESVEFHRIVMFGKTAQLANQYLKKGSQVVLEGKNATRSWEDKDGKKVYITEVKVDKMEFISTGSRETQGNQERQYAPNDPSF